VPMADLATTDMEEAPAAAPRTYTKGAALIVTMMVGVATCVAATRTSFGKEPTRVQAQPATVELVACPAPAPSWVLPHKGCPTDNLDASCVAHNRHYNTFEEAWAACGTFSECGFIVLFTDGRFYLRRASDPDFPIAGSWSMPYSCGAVHEYVEEKPTQCLSQETDVDVVVVGAGISGLIAARELEKAHFTVQVIEAMPRIGGRMFKEDLSPTQAVDYGGQWLGPTHTEFKALMQELGLGAATRFKAPTLATGTTFLYSGTKITFTAEEIAHWSELGGALGVPNSAATADVVSEGEATLLQTSGGDIDLKLGFVDGLACLTKLEEMKDKMPAGLWPYDLPEEFAKYDTLTFGQFVDSLGLSGLGKFICKSSPRINHAGGPSDASDSLLFILWTLKNSPDSELPLDMLIHGGAGQVPPLLVKQLDRSVELGDPVVVINQTSMAGTPCSARVQTASGKVLRTSNVVVAVPPAVSGMISYNPPLSWQRMQLNQLSNQGRGMKIMIEAPKKIWDTAVFLASIDSSLFSACFDSTDPRSKEAGSDKAVAICLVMGEVYDKWSNLTTLQAREDAVKREMAKWCGEEASSITSIHFGDWPANPWVQGGYGMHWAPGTWSRFGPAMVEPHGAIQWASSEIAMNWHGYFEGAIRTGKQAAENIRAGKKGKLIPKIPSGDYNFPSA